MEAHPAHLRALPLQPTGNVLTISLHQENDSRSDIRTEAELFAWRVSPGAGTAPATPTSLAVGNPTFTELELTWTLQADAKFFNIERLADGDLVWEVVQFEYPGTFSRCVDTNLQSGMTYHYRMTAVNIHGRSACSEVASDATEISLIPVIFEENFDIQDRLGQFTQADVLEPTKSWSWLLWDFGSTRTADRPCGRYERRTAGPAYCLRLPDEWTVEPNDDELVVVRLTGRNMASDAERVVVVIQHADMLFVKQNNVFDRPEPGLLRVIV